MRAWREACDEEIREQNTRGNKIQKDSNLQLIKKINTKTQRGKIMRNLIISIAVLPAIEIPAAIKKEYGWLTDQSIPE